MFPRHWIAIPAIVLAPAAMAAITYTGGDGSSLAAAIHIVGAAGEDDGVASEYQWIGAHRPGAKVLRQALVMNGGRAYDILSIRHGATSEDVFFDITDYFGK